MSSLSGGGERTGLRPDVENVSVTSHLASPNQLVSLVAAGLNEAERGDVRVRRLQRFEESPTYTGNFYAAASRNDPLRVRSAVTGDSRATGKFKQLK